jgi:hypothetical protein
MPTDLSRPEATLIAQAHTLDSLFHMLTGWALTNANSGKRGVPRDLHAAGIQSTEPVARYD